jgi:hypothetical protein
MAVPDYLQDFVTDFARQAKATYSAPLEPSTFMGPQFVQGLDPLQTQAIGLAQAGVGSYAPFLQSAQQAITQAGQDVSGLAQFAGTGAGTGAGSIQDFQSPYQQAVIDETLRQFDESRVGGRQTIQDAAVQAGAFGGGREGALLGQFDADSLIGREGLRAGLLQQGFQDAAARRAQAFGQQQALAGARAGLAGQQFGLSNFMTRTGTRHICIRRPWRIKTRSRSSKINSTTTNSTSNCNGTIWKIRKIWHSFNWIIRWCCSSRYANTNTESFWHGAI